MKIEAVRMVLIMVLLSLGFSCKVYRDVENLRPKVSREAKAGPFDESSLGKLIEGDLVIVKTLTGKEFKLTFTEIVGGSLSGIASKIDDKILIPKEKVEIPISDIENLNVRRVSPAATVPIVIFGALGIIIGIYAATAVAYW